MGATEWYVQVSKAVGPENLVGSQKLKVVKHRNITMNDVRMYRWGKVA